MRQSGSQRVIWWTRWKLTPAASAISLSVAPRFRAFRIAASRAFSAERASAVVQRMSSSSVLAIITPFPDRLVDVLSGMPRSRSFAASACNLLGSHPFGYVGDRVEMLGEFTGGSDRQTDGGTIATADPSSFGFADCLRNVLPWAGLQHHPMRRAAEVYIHRIHSSILEQTCQVSLSEGPA